MIAVKSLVRLTEGIIEAFPIKLKSLQKEDSGDAVNNIFVETHIY